MTRECDGCGHKHPPHHFHIDDLGSWLCVGCYQRWLDKIMREDFPEMFPAPKAPTQNGDG